MKNTTWTEEEYGGIYERLEQFPPKELLDSKIVEIINQYTGEQGLATCNVAELGAGPAPISRLLKEKYSNTYQCSAFDINPDMKGNHNLPFRYESNFDLTHQEIPEEEIGKYDVVVMENSLYATTMAPDGTPKYTPDEASLMRLNSFKKAAAMLRPEGILILSDPLNTTENFGIQRIVEFLKKEQDAVSELKNEKKSIFEIFLDHLGDPKMMKILKANRGIMKRSVLMNEEEMKKMVSDSGLFFEPKYWDPKTYLGSNLTTVLRRNNQQIEKNNEQTVLGKPILLEGAVNRRILHWIGYFRKKIYAISNTTNNLPEVDKYDLKQENLVLVYPAKNKIGIGATATLQERGEIGLDAEHLMLPEEGDFYTQLTSQIAKSSEKVSKALESGRPINYAEIRRLAADNLCRTEFFSFFENLFDNFDSYSRKKGIDVVLFISDDKRAKAFNLANRHTEFKKVEGFKLNRENINYQTMMISAANYFFGDWRKYLEEDEIETITNLSSMIKNGDIWTEKVQGHTDEEKYHSAVKSLMEKTPDNVSIYYTDYTMNI